MNISRVTKTELLFILNEKKYFEILLRFLILLFVFIFIHSNKMYYLQKKYYIYRQFYFDDKIEAI